jgi:hypothetical protein
LLVDGDPNAIRVCWKRVAIVVQEEPLTWSETATLQFASPARGKS